jgi:flavin-dependent dehydrogenase
MIEADVVVVGAGPSGATFALNLAPMWRVLVVDRQTNAGQRIGESLAPAARRLLTDMGLWDAFLAQGHSPAYGGRSIWSGSEPTERDNLRDLDGPGWHLDRRRFDAWLRAVAVQRGSAILIPARLRTIVRHTPQEEIAPGRRRGDILHEARPGDIAGATRRGEILPEARPAGTLPKARPGDILPGARPGGIVPEASPGNFMRGARPHAETWQFKLLVDERLTSGRTRLLVDAGGRGSSVARGLGARRIVEDRLVCGWLHGVDQPGRQSGLTHIEAEPDGWWYTAPLPDNRRVVAFHTDADLAAATIAAAGPTALLRRVSALGLFPDVLTGSGFTPIGGGGFCAAHSTALTPSVGEGWLAVGDAALSFDPLSSQGLFNALYTGLAAAEAADRFLAGDGDALRGYQAVLASAHAAYRTHLQGLYRLERRWPERPFWQRRMATRSFQAAPS